MPPRGVERSARRRTRTVYHAVATDTHDSARVLLTSELQLGVHSLSNLHSNRAIKQLVSRIELDSF
jgi:hypothetical protein